MAFRGRYMAVIKLNSEALSRLRVEASARAITSTSTERSTDILKQPSKARHASSPLRHGYAECGPSMASMDAASQILDAHDFVKTSSNSCIHEIGPAAARLFITISWDRNRGLPGTTPWGRNRGVVLKISWAISRISRLGLRLVVDREWFCTTPTIKQTHAKLQNYAARDSLIEPSAHASTRQGRRNCPLGHTRRWRAGRALPAASACIDSREA